MKKILGAALITAMVAFPMAAGATTQASAVSTVHPQESTNVVSPDGTKFVSVWKVYSQADYTFEWDLPRAIWYDENTYRGTLNIMYVSYSPTDFTWTVLYGGDVFSYIFL